ncbi:MAG: pyridoxal phosphate-dependent aminotransferase [Gammaproteobacteria bacterium]
MNDIILAARVGRIKPSPTIAVSTRAKELRAEGRDIINLGSGEPDFDTPQHIKDAAAAAMRDGETKYTAVGGTPALKNAVREKLRRENALQYAPEQIIVSTGAKHSLMNLMFAVLDAEDEVVIPAPYWVSYPDMALLADARPVFVAADAAQGYKITPRQLRDAISPKSKLLILNSPSNPSGAMYSSDELAALGEVVAANPRLLVATDDIYEHIRYDGRPFANIVNVRPDLADRVVVVNGVSKAYAMTGWRIGYAAGPERVIKAMTKIQSQGTSNPCSIAQAAAAAALDGGAECVAPMLEAFARRREIAREGLNAAPGIVCGEIAGAFYAFADAREAIVSLHSAEKIPAADDLALCEYLLEKAEVAAVPGSAFGAPGCFRISFATSDENLQNAVSRIQNALS